MTNSKLRSLDLIQVDGGLSTKQGDTWSRIAYQLVDENEESIRITDATSVAVYLKNENGLYQLDGLLEGDEVGFYLTPQVVNGSYQVEIQIKHETGRISKFPSTNTVTLKVVKSLVNQESLTISVIDTYKNNNLPEDPETGEKVLVAGDNSIGWYRDHTNAREIVLTTNASDPLKLYSDFPEKRPFEPDNSSNYDHHKSSFVDIYANDILTGGYIHERRHNNGHYIIVSVRAFMIEEPRVLSIPITDMSTGASATFDIKVYPYNWYDPETKQIRKPVTEESPTESQEDNRETENNPEHSDTTTSPQEGNTVNQPVIDNSHIVGPPVTISTPPSVDESDGVVIRGDIVPGLEEDYEQIWPIIEKDTLTAIEQINDLGYTLDRINGKDYYISPDKSSYLEIIDEYTITDSTAVNIYWAEIINLPTFHGYEKTLIPRVYKSLSDNQYYYLKTDNTLSNNPLKPTADSYMEDFKVQYMDLGHPLSSELDTAQNSTLIELSIIGDNPPAFYEIKKDDLIPAFDDNRYYPKSIEEFVGDSNAVYHPIDGEPYPIFAKLEHYASENEDYGYYVRVYPTPD